MPERAKDARADHVACHAFISYVREDAHKVARLQRKLEEAGVRVWRDTQDLWPGQDWRAVIRQAIQGDALVFIACFSRQSLARSRSYQNEELVLAIEELRLRRSDVTWLIPVRFDDCEIPDLDIGGGRSLRSIQCADLFGKEANRGFSRLVASVLQVFERSTDAPAETAQPRPAEKRKETTVKVDSKRVSAAPSPSYEVPVLGAAVRSHGQPTHHGSHKRLLAASPARAHFSPDRALDAIIVPSHRPAANLEHAITAARSLGCRLLALCSGGARASDAFDLFSSYSFNNAFAFDIPNGYSHRFLKFKTSLLAKDGLPGYRAEFDTNLSTKRNVGLLLARMLGWRRILFLDDNIRDVAIADLECTSSMLDTHNAVGLRVGNFPDNSVVCHAFRTVGGLQDTFIGGGALAVNVGRSSSFFPKIYNGDWFFFYDDAANGLLASSGRKVTQLRYDPFADPQLAVAQEFGDLLAEGIFALLHQNSKAEHATRDYWTYFIRARQDFLETIIQRSDRAPSAIRQHILRSVGSALECLAVIRPEMCERYISLWREDLQRWTQTIADLPSRDGMRAAANELGLQFNLQVDSIPEIVLVPHSDAFESLREGDSAPMWGTATATAMKRAMPLVPSVLQFPGSPRM